MKAKVVPKPKLTKEEFERQWCARSYLTVEQLAEYGRRAIPAEEDWPCDYGEDCEGWHMVTKDWEPPPR